jgi:cell division protein ZapA
MSTEAVTIHILDRDYQVACLPEERNGLMAAAVMLDRKMKEVRNSARTASLDRIAVLAALNLAHELHNTKTQVTREDEQMSTQIENLKRKLDASVIPFLK